MNLLGVVVRYQQSFFPDRHGKPNKRNTDILRVHARFASHSFISSTIPEKKWHCSQSIIAVGYILK